MNAHTLARLLVALLLAGAATARAAPHGMPQGAPDQPPLPPMDEMPRSAEAAARYPQPVLVGTLAGRPVIQNNLRQGVLGHVAGAVRDGDGTVRLLVDRGRWASGPRVVAVPAAAMALLGHLVVLHDLPPEALPGLPAADATGGRLAPGETIRIGLARN